MLNLQCYHCWSMRSPGFPDDGDEEGGLANVSALSVKSWKPMTSRAYMLSSYHGYTAVVMSELCLSFYRLVQCKQKLSTTIPFLTSSVAPLYSINLQLIQTFDLNPVVGGISTDNQYYRIWQARCGICAMSDTSGRKAAIKYIFRRAWKLGKNPIVTRSDVNYQRIQE